MHYRSRSPKAFAENVTGNVHSSSLLQMKKLSRDRHWLMLTSLHVCSVSQSCLILCDPLDCSPPGSSVHGIFQARIMEWVAISSPRGSSWPRDWTRFSFSLLSPALQVDSLPAELSGKPTNLPTEDQSHEKNSGPWFFCHQRHCWGKLVCIFLSLTPTLETLEPFPIDSHIVFFLLVWNVHLPFHWSSYYFMSSFFPFNLLQYHPTLSFHLITFQIGLIQISIYFLI